MSWNIRTIIYGCVQFNWGPPRRRGNKNSFLPRPLVLAWESSGLEPELLLLLHLLLLQVFFCPAGAFLLRCFLPRRRFYVTTFFYVNHRFSVVLGGMWDRAAARLTKMKREEGGEGGGGGEGPTVSETRYPPTP